MTNPHYNPFGPNPFGSEPFGGAPFGHVPQGGSPTVPSTPVHPNPAGGEANTLATLSPIFAFVFAPAGAVLGHLALAQITRTGQRGRDRALVGITLSYSVIAVAVAALVWAAVTDNRSGRQTAAPAPGTPTAAPVTSTTTTPPPPTLAPAALAGLLPSADDDKRITGNQNLRLQDTATEMTPDSGTVDNENCWSALLLGSSHHYDLPAMTGVYATNITDRSDPVAHPYYVQQLAAAYRDSAAAQQQLAGLTGNWRRCGGSSVLNVQSTGANVPYLFATPVPDAGGVTTIDCSQRNPPVPDPPLKIARAVAAKNNIVIDVAVAFRAGDNSQHGDALAIANFILDKIPGPR